MKLKIKEIVCLIVFVVILGMIAPKSQAAGIVIAFSKSNANVGDTVTVTVTGTGVAGKVDLTVSGNATLSENSVFVDNNSASVNAQITGEGSIRITATAADMAYSDTAGVYNGSTAGTITVASSNNGSTGTGSTSGESNSGAGSGTTTAPATKSSNANLSNLGITPNDFKGFTPSKTSYTVTVPNNVSSIQIYANKAQKGQKISGTGAKNLNEGANSFNIIVTEEDGTTTKTYTLTVNREPAENTAENTEVNNEEQNNETAETTTTENKEEIFGLSELKIDGIELTPKFSSDVYEYTAKLIGENDKVDIVTKATDEGAKVEITGNENLKEGENIITILVSNEAGDKSTAYQIKLTKSLVDEEALAKEKEIQEQEKTRNIIIVCCAVALLLVIIIILIWRHKRNKRLAEEYSIPYQGFNDDDYDNYNDNNNNFNQANIYEKITDKFDNDSNNDIQTNNQLLDENNKIDDNKNENLQNTDKSKNDENTEVLNVGKRINNDSNEWYNKDLSKNIDETDSILEDKDELRRQYLNQSFDNDIDFDSKPKKRHSKGKRFK